MTRPLNVRFSDNKTVGPVKNSQTPNSKRTVGDEDIYLPFSRIAKRRSELKSLYVNEYETLCAHMEDLSHTSRKDHSQKTEFDTLLDALGDLGVDSSVTAANWNLQFVDLLSLDWHSHIPPLTAARGNVCRAIRLCRHSGVKSYRDVLWYNDSLSQAASLQKFPQCLVDIGYALTDWDPRKRRPQTTLLEWTNAWQALTNAWPIIVLAMPPDLRQKLLHRKHSGPPPTANWFEFNFFDGVYSERAPLLCYHEDPAALEDAIKQDAIDLCPVSPNMLAEPQSASVGVGVRKVISAFDRYSEAQDEEYLSDEDPRRPRSGPCLQPRFSGNETKDLEHRTIFSG